MDLWQGFHFWWLRTQLRERVLPVPQTMGAVRRLVCPLTAVPVSCWCCASPEPALLFLSPLNLQKSCQLVRAWPRSNRTQHDQNPKCWTLAGLWESRWFSENWLPRPGCAHLAWQDWPCCPHTAYLHCAPCSGAGLTCGSPYLGAGLLFLPAPSWGTWSSPRMGSWSLMDRTASCLPALPPGRCTPPTV